jgi:hypothetical protein
VRTLIGFLDDLVMQLHDGFPQEVQNRRTVPRQMVVPPSTRPGTGLSLAPQPTVAFHALQKWVQRTGTDIVTVSPQLSQHPLADDGMLIGVMEDVDLPESEENFAGQKL